VSSFDHSLAPALERQLQEDEEEAEVEAGIAGAMAPVEGQAVAPERDPDGEGEEYLDPRDYVEDSRQGDLHVWN